MYRSVLHLLIIEEPEQLLMHLLQHVHARLPISIRVRICQLMPRLMKHHVITISRI